MPVKIYGSNAKSYSTINNTAFLLLDRRPLRRYSRDIHPLRLHPGRVAHWAPDYGQAVRRGVHFSRRPRLRAGHAVAHDEAAGRKPVATEGAIKYRRLVWLQNESLASRHMPRPCLGSLTDKTPADQ